MKLSRKTGSTSQILQIFIRDSSSTTGAGLTGLTNASSSLTAYYHRDTDTTATVISLVSMTVGTFTSSGFKEIDATNMPGHYQFCPPNAAFNTGAASVMFHLKGATNMAPLPIEVDLDTQADVTHWNGTAVSTPSTAGIPDVNMLNISNAAVNNTQAQLGCNVVGWNGSFVATPATAGIPEVNIKNINNISASSVTSVNAKQGTTQNIGFTVSGQVDSNIQYVNDIQVNGVGTSGSPWGP